MRSGAKMLYTVTVLSIINDNWFFVKAKILADQCWGFVTFWYGSVSESADPY